MKTVTQKFVDAQTQPNVRVIRQVAYKRRYWSPTTGAYIWESSWNVLNEGTDVVRVSPVVWTLDLTQIASFKASSVTVTLRNEQNQWGAENPFGYFGQDATSPLFGYEPYFTKVQIRAGLWYADGTTELLNLFTGVATEYLVESAKGLVQVQVTGEQALLTNANAELVSTNSGVETLGTGNGVTTIFTTAHNGVGIFLFVWTSANTTPRAGIDYTISQLNDPLNPGKITFTAAPANTVTIYAIYLYWQQSQKFETLVTNLLNQAGIPGGNQQVSSVIFPSNIINTHTWQTQADWQGGSSLTAIDTTSIVDSIEYQYGSAQTWNTSTSGWTTNLVGGDTFTTSSSKNVLSTIGHAGNDSLVYRASTTTVGDWIISFTGAIGASQNLKLNIFLMGGTDNGAGALNNTYYIGINFGGNGVGSVFLHRTGALYLAGAYPTGGVPGNSAHVVRVRRNGNGLFSVYFNGTLLGTVTDTTYTTSTNFGYAFDITGIIGATSTVTFDTSTALNVPTSSDGLGTWISAAVDFGATPTSWANLTSSQSLNGGAVTYSTAASPDNITYDAYVVVSAGIIGSTLRRYLKVKSIIDITNGDPVIAAISIWAFTTSTTVALANFTQQTCYDAIASLAQFANYEFGFDGSENFFFRPRKSSNTPMMFLGKTNYLKAVLSRVTGYDRVMSDVLATYGSYSFDANDDGKANVSPLARFGYIRNQINGGSLLISADANVAQGVSLTNFIYYGKNRRRYKVQTTFLPQLDISDVVQITFDDWQPIPGWFLGDPTKNLQSPTAAGVTPTSLQLYGAGQQTVYKVNCKVIGQRIDTESWDCEYDFEEVLP